MALGQEDEETFCLISRASARARVEHRFSPTLSGFIGYRLEYDKLEEVANATVQALGGIKEKGFLSGPPRQSRGLTSLSYRRPTGNITIADVLAAINSLDEII